MKQEHVVIGAAAAAGVGLYLTKRSHAASPAGGGGVVASDGRVDFAAVYRAQRTLAFKRFGALPGGGEVVPRVSADFLRELGTYWELEVASLTGLDNISGQEASGGLITGGMTPAERPSFDNLRRGRLHSSPWFYDGPLFREMGEVLLDAWGTFLDTYSHEVLFRGGGFDNAGLLSAQGTRAWWLALAKLSVFMAGFANPKRILSSWEGFLKDAEELPADLAKAAADAAAAAARAGASGVGAFIGQLFKTPGGLLVLGGALAFVFRAELVKVATRR